MGAFNRWVEPTRDFESNFITNIVGNLDDMTSRFPGFV
jgi:hypothetical protein